MHPGRESQRISVFKGRGRGWRHHRLRQKIKKENFKWKKENREVIVEARRGGNSRKSV